MNKRKVSVSALAVLSIGTFVNGSDDCTYNLRLGRYIDTKTGQIVSFEKGRAFFDAQILQAEKPTEKLTKKQAVLKGKIKNTSSKSIQLLNSEASAVVTAKKSFDRVIISEGKLDETVKRNGLAIRARNKTPLVPVVNSSVLVLPISNGYEQFKNILLKAEELWNCQLEKKLVLAPVSDMNPASIASVSKAANSTSSVGSSSALHTLKSYIPFIKAKSVATAYPAAAFATPVIAAGVLGKSYYDQMQAEAVVKSTKSAELTSKFAKFKSVLVDAKNSVTDIVKNNKTGSVMAGSAIAATIGLVAYNRYNAKPAEPAEEAVKRAEEVAKPTVEQIATELAKDSRAMAAKLKAHGYTRADVTEKALVEVGKLNKGQALYVLNQLSQ